MTHEGRVLFYHVHKGWGFIYTMVDKEVQSFFVHHGGILGKGLKVLKREQRVRFNVRDGGDRGPIAYDVQIINQEERVENEQRLSESCATDGSTTEGL